MPHVFLSYASEDRARVLPLVEALQEDGFTVWWDRDIRPGPSFDREIERAIDEAICMVVVWSSRSVESEWVRSEVEEGVRRGILVPVLIEAVMPPLAYRRRQAADLTHWQGEHDGEYAKLLGGIRATLASVEGVGASDPSGTASQDRVVGGVAAGASAPRARRRVRKVSMSTAIMAAVLAALAVAAGGWLALGRSGGEPGVAARHPVRFELPLPPGMSIPTLIGNKANITRDGRTVTFFAGRGDENQYLLRDLDDLAARPVRGVPDRLGSHWLSPDGTSLVFSDETSRTYRKVPLEGGASLAIAPTGTRGTPATAIRGLAWSSDGQVAFASGDVPGIQTVPATGGTPVVLTTPGEGRLHREPRYTADGRALLFVDYAFSQTSEFRDPIVQVLDRSSGEIRSLGPGRYPQSTTSGHLLLVRDGVLHAAVFDSNTLALRSEPVPVLEGVGEWSTTYQVSDNGTLIYVPEPRGGTAQVAWVGLDGGVEPLPVSAESIGQPRLSADGRHLLLSMNAQAPGRELAIWNHDLSKGTTSRLNVTPQGQLGVSPVWGRNATEYLYMQGEQLQFDLFLGSADGARDPVRLTRDAQVGQPTIAPDGRTVVLLACPAGDRCDIASTTLDGGGLTLLLETDFDERTPELSPDGRWLAYSSDESGRRQIFVRPFPDLESGRWQVSSEGGEIPLWSKDGTQLFFVERETQQLMRLDVATSDGFRAGVPEAVMDLTAYDWAIGSRDARNFDISNDGERFLMVGNSGGADRLVVVLDWLQELGRLVPVD